MHASTQNLRSVGLFVAPTHAGEQDTAGSLMALQGVAVGAGVGQGRAEGC